MQCVGVMYEVRFYTGWRKSAWPNLHKVNLHRDTRKKYYMKHGLQVMAPDDWETVQSVHVELPCRYCRRANCGDLLCFTRSDRGCLPQFPLKCLSTAVAKYESADWDSFMVLCIVVPHHIVGNFWTICFWNNG